MSIYLSEEYWISEDYWSTIKQMMSMSVHGVNFWMGLACSLMSMEILGRLIPTFKSLKPVKVLFLISTFLLSLGGAIVIAYQPSIASTYFVVFGVLSVCLLPYF